MNLILIADDDPDLRELLSFTLGTAGFHTISAEDGDSAARLLTTAQPIGMITDLAMPGADGVQLCRLARSNPASRNMAIVMISGHHTPQPRRDRTPRGRRSLPDQTTVISQHHSRTTASHRPAPSHQRQPSIGMTAHRHSPSTSASKGKPSPARESAVSRSPRSITAALACRAHTHVPMGARGWLDVSQLNWGSLTRTGAD